jgi:regulator of sigma E protease
MIAQLLCGLALLIFVHEFGHFLAARIFKVRVPKFYLFFNPSFSIFKCKKFNGKFHFKFFAKNLPDTEKVLDENGDEVLDEKGKAKMQVIDKETLSDDDWRKYPDNTEYGIGWLPLGGYCQISGMIDETQTINNMPSEPQPWEYRSKPAWQRLIIVLGGVIVNMIVGVLLFAVVIGHFQKQYIANEDVTDGIYAFEAAQNMGFQTGDKIICIDGEKKERFSDAASPNMLMGSIVTVDRNGEKKDIVIGDEGYQVLKTSQGRFIDMANFIPLIDSILPDMPLHGKGFQKGDIICAINDSILITSYGDLLEKLPLFTSKSIDLKAIRGKDTISNTVEVDSNGKLGFLTHIPYQTHNYTLWQSFKYGWQEAIDMLVVNAKGFGKIFSGKEKVTALSGPIGIAQIYGKVWDWHRFWRITGLLSLLLAFMNILPIPGLDGGHALVALIELIIRRKVPDKVVQIALNIGFILLLLLMVFAFGNDIFKLFQ